MSLLDRLRPGRESIPIRPVRSGTPVFEPPKPASVSGEVRASHALKDFLWLLEGIGHGSLLDLGQVWQSTVGFFVERGFRVYSEDVLRAWKGFLETEEERQRATAPAEDPSELNPAARAARFLDQNLRFAEDTFDAVLCWDLLEYLDPEAVSQVVERMAGLLKDGGVVLALFHSRKPEAFHRYRIADHQNIELVRAPLLVPSQRTFQNREMLNLFSRFQSSKTYVGRDQIREALFVR